MRRGERQRREREGERKTLHIKIRISWPMVDERSDCMDAVYA